MGVRMREPVMCLPGIGKTPKYRSDKKNGWLGMILDREKCVFS